MSNVTRQQTDLMEWVEVVNNHEETIPPFGVAMVEGSESDLGIEILQVTRPDSSTAQGQYLFNGGLPIPSGKRGRMAFAGARMFAKFDNVLDPEIGQECQPKPDTWTMRPGPGGHVVIGRNVNGDCWLIREKNATGLVKIRVRQDLEQGQDDPVDAYLLSWNGDEAEWQPFGAIQVYGDAGFQGVLFGERGEGEGLVLGDIADAYIASNGLYYAIVGNTYLHGTASETFSASLAGNVLVNDDGREITIEAYSPYGVTYEGDFVALNWNNLALHWDAERGGVPVWGCGLDYDEESNTLSVDNVALAGDGLIASEEDCSLSVDPDFVEDAFTGGCGVTVASGVISVNAGDLAGDGLEASGECGLAIAVGCGLKIEEGAVAVDPEALEGAGIVAAGCGFDVQVGECLIIDGDNAVAVDTQETGTTVIGVVTDVTISGNSLLVSKANVTFSLNTCGLLVGVMAGTPTVTPYAIPCTCDEDSGSGSGSGSDGGFSPDGCASVAALAINDTGNQDPCEDGGSYNGFGDNTGLGGSIDITVTNTTGGNITVDIDSTGDLLTSSGEHWNNQVISGGNDLTLTVATGFGGGARSQEFTVAITSGSCTGSITFTLNGVLT